MSYLLWSAIRIYFEIQLRLLCLKEIVVSVYILFILQFKIRCSVYLRKNGVCYELVMSHNL